MDLDIGDDEVAGIIMAVAWQQYRRLSMSKMFELEWFVNSAWVGAMRAVENPKFERGRPGWKAYVGARAFGNIRDDLRDFDECPRVMRQRGQAPKVVSFDAMVNEKGENFGFDQYGPIWFDAEPTDDFWNAIGRMVQPNMVRPLRLYFKEGLTMKECGEQIGVSESRVSQLIKLGLSILRAKRKDIMKIMGRTN